jgi:hypothetical protein
MRLSAPLLFASLFLPAVALAQVPDRIGNRANGRDYQPTPSQVAPAERQASVQPNARTEQSENRDLEKIDRDALRSEGMSTKSVPDMTKPQ